MAAILSWPGTLVVFLLAAAVVEADDLIGAPAAEVVRYMRSLDPAGRGAFVNSCVVAQSPEDGREHFVLIVGRTADSSATLVWTRYVYGKQVTINVAELEISRDSVKTVEAMGGVWTYQYLESVARDLLKGQFVYSSDYADIFEVRGHGECHQQPQ